MFRLNINSCPIGTLGFWRKNKIKNKRFKNRCVKCAVDYKETGMFSFYSDGYEWLFRLSLPVRWHEGVS